MAMNHNIYISIGLVEKEGDRLYDSAILIDNRGNIFLKHRKINIPEAMI
jgi:predicted amidohydrolase